MKDNGHAMVLASFQGDALALGAHWIYDTDAIEKKVGRVDRLLAPIESTYHPTKGKGDFTHYGDQTLVLLRHLAENDGFDLHRFGTMWRHAAENSNAYSDRATRETLAAITDGKSWKDCGSSSSDLGGPARLAPLIHWYRDQPEKLHELARQQTLMTHSGSGIVAGTSFLVDTVLAALAGASPTDAIDKGLDAGVADIDLDMRLARARQSIGQDSRKAIAELGQQCSIAAALPAAVHLVLSYPDDPRRAFVENVMAGGDSAARGLVIGMIFGAALGEAALMEDWLEELRARQVIENCLDRAP